ncbi:MAG: Ig-like domain-containing protein [Terracidiphilus sp.]
MTHITRGISFAASLILISTVAVAPQAQAQSTTAAYVYVQIGGPAGAVYGYSASSSGTLAAISGSPFKTGTAIVGSNNSQFFTLGQTTLHSFAIASNGAIGSQVGSAAVFDYAGNSCGGGPNGLENAVLDHTGKYVYVELQGAGDGTCAAYQTYIVNSDGTLTFDGDTEQTFESEAGTGVPSILGNETFAYATEWDGHYTGDVGFKRQSTGTLETIQFKETDPTLSGTFYLPSSPDASPTGNYVVLQLYPSDGGGDSGNPQLGSYSVDSSGNLTTTNTSSNMPTPSLGGGLSTFSPDGTMFVLYNSGTGAYGGIEIYNFNGAAPLTLNTTLLNGTPISHVAWDTSHHLYVISQAENTMWVFNVTPTSVAQTAKLSIGTPFSIVVASHSASSACAAPTSDGVNVCSPANGATVNSPVQITAAATVSGGVYRFELWNGDTKLLSDDNGTMDQTVTLAPGTYKLTFDARNSSGTHEYAYRDITVQ